ncbi:MULTISPECIES: Nif3-like dinuclear metal center hexameric protein [Paenibacillus]|jgi:dinuclear metal center YbgI/SA1388 family protein|uniref:GTP cyclohydrolase 1 type 2 homolog n=1 Tax=Paenibacillus odorifer TaxID=189426 RepID=A0A1R0YYL5_9BACL|nr:Nif3-like dinuclear metal center hexameric protein [Paenibacillus odorifer]AWV35280.1 Nif3-like dinuclear metal center hexameric protein [Paenibacillus odorifer]MEC0132196.1 Nif3-like dinuclear metal center hexameric protein [Paenibacillus odorifer]MEC0223637.1 Nif3-like dinuclear metal center hexameric protein [Paenibacillus odorifer]OMC72892.1 Nif3-like dinuclear metal center hexameric protein [Paenibacillus odorifer]OMC76418.1 Nif3-like dinuclear metal center hexameric protein [Paenibaci
MFAKGQTVIQYMEQLAPKHLAEDWDKIGLQLGTLQKEITNVLVALDVNDEVVEEAIRLGCNLIIAHHAIIFRPLQGIQTDTPAGKMYEKLIKNDIAVYISHTNLDVTEGGMNDWMAEALGIENGVPIKDIHSEQLSKLVVFVPKDHHQKVLDAILNAGAGAIGNYSHCSFNIEGYGTFIPGEGTDPYIGEKGKMERAEEIRIETIVPHSIRNKVVQAMLKAHPYEEVAYDLYSMDLKGRSLGLGRVGKLKEPTTLGQFVETVKKGLKVDHVRVVGDLDRPIRKAAVLGGSGGKYYNSAIFRGADVLVTGDLDYHTVQDAALAGITLIDPGHNAEKIMKEKVAEWMAGKLAEHKYDTAVHASQVNTEPFKFL